MSILGTIMSKVFGHDTAAPASSAPSETPAPAANSPAATPPAAPMSQTDVESILTEMAKAYSHPVNWKSSIVDLMAMLGMDNSLAQRRALAGELGYTGDTNDTATMNIWLHKQVMQKLAEHQGVASADLMK
ncbi:MAG: DUF3597 domain-containing protein [Gemmatimonadaceae bacterium]